MIANTIKLLQTRDFLGVSQAVEIAKGKYQIASTFKIGKRKIVRKWHAKRKLK